MEPNLEERDGSVPLVLREERAIPVREGTEKEKAEKTNGDGLDFDLSSAHGGGGVRG